MKPLIGITTGEIVNHAEPWNSITYGQKHEYSEAIIAAGGLPIFIPFMPEAELKTLYEKLDGILFAGGNDIDPRLYGEEPAPQTVDISPQRDRQESLLMSWALNDNKSLFAICRGYQLFNILLGGNLHQDIETELPNSADHELSFRTRNYTDIAHTLKVEASSRLASIMNDLSVKANSRHHQAIKHVAKELRPVAWAEDGIIEALEHPLKRFALGVQCHPESLYTFDPKWAAVFKAFVKAANDKPVVKLFKFKKKTRLTQ